MISPAATLSLARVILWAKDHARRRAVRVKLALTIQNASFSGGRPTADVNHPSFATHASCFRGQDLDKRVGKFTHIHPVTITIGKYPEKTLPAYGVPDNMWTPKFAPGPTGYLIETGSFFPVLSASATLQHGEELHRIMRDYYPTGAISNAHHTTGFDDKEKYGTVELDQNGDPQLDYQIPKANVKPMQESLVMMARIHLAAGATSVYIMRNPPLEVKPGDTFDEIRKINFTEPQRASIFTVHVMGGCQMHKDDKRRCVNNDFTFKGKKNLWVVDGSIFPTALGANPQVTIYSLALWAAREICEQNQKPF